MPRFMRLVLFLATLSLLIVPLGDTAKAQTEGELVGGLTAGNAFSCAPAPPDPDSLSHVRCTGGAFDSGGVTLEATRAAGADIRTVRCEGPVSAIGFDTRETVAEGRGRIPLVHFDIPGTNTHSGSTTDTLCDVRIEGTFHRVGTVAIGRLRITVRSDAGLSREFHHHYCVRFDATAVPGDPTLVAAAVEGRMCPEGSADPDSDRSHGRDPADDADTLHGGRILP